MKKGSPYLHLGEGVTLRCRDLIGVFDLERSTVSPLTRRFLADAQKGGRVVTVSYEMPKAFAVCAEPDGSETVYVTSIAAATLRRRAEKGDL